MPDIPSPSPHLGFPDLASLLDPKNSIRHRHLELRDADLDKENGGNVGFGHSSNHKVPDLNASAKRKFVLRFGNDKFSNDMHVSQIKAIYGKHVKEGKLTLEDKSNVRVLIKSTPSECQRLMKTLTTLKGAPKEVQNTHLAGLGSCSKCASKHAASAAKAEERRKKIVAAQLAQAEAELQRKRKREQGEADREGEKARKLSEQLQRVEDMRAAKEKTKEQAKEDITQAKRLIEEKRNAARTEKDRLNELAEHRKAVSAEHKRLETEQNELDVLRQRLETQRQRAESDKQALAAQLDANKQTLQSLEVVKKQVEKERATIQKERERVEAETMKYEEQRKTLEQTKAKWEETKKYKDDEAAYKAAAAERRRADASAKKDETSRKKAERDAAAAAKAANTKVKQDAWAKEYERWERTGASSGAPEYPREDDPTPSTSPSSFYGASTAPAKGKTKKATIPGAEANPLEQELSKRIVELDPFSGVDRARVKEALKEEEE